MWLFLDLLVICIIALITLLSAKRGFVRVLIELVGMLLAVSLAFSLSAVLAGAVYDNLIEPSVISSAEKVSAGSADEIVGATWDALPSFVTNNAASFGLSREDFSRKISESVGNGAAGAAEIASQNVVKPIVTRLLGLLFTIILLIIFTFIVKILARLLNKLFSFSLLGKMNHTLGGIVGFLKGIIIAAALCMAISLIVSFTANGFLIFTAEAIDKSYLFRALASLSPFN